MTKKTIKIMITREQFEDALNIVIKYKSQIETEIALFKENEPSLKSLISEGKDKFLIETDIPYGLHNVLSIYFYGYGEYDHKKENNYERLRLVDLSFICIRRLNTIKGFGHKKRIELFTFCERNNITLNK